MPTTTFGGLSCSRTEHPAFAHGRLCGAANRDGLRTPPDRLDHARSDRARKAGVEHQIFLVAGDIHGTD